MCFHCRLIDNWQAHFGNDVDILHSILKYTVPSVQSNVEIIIQINSRSLFSQVNIRMESYFVVDIFVSQTLNKQLS